MCVEKTEGFQNIFITSLQLHSIKYTQKTKKRRMLTYLSLSSLLTSRFNNFFVDCDRILNGFDKNFGQMIPLIFFYVSQDLKISVSKPKKNHLKT